MSNKCSYLSEEFLRYFEAYRRTLNNDRTAIEYRRNINILCEYIKKDFLEIDATDAAAFFSYMEQRVQNGSIKNTTVNTRLYCYRKVADFIEENHPESGYRNAFLMAEPQRGIKNQIYPSRIPTLAEIDLLLSQVDSPMYYLILCMALRIALSVSDIVSLKLSYIQHFDTNYCLHYPPKDRFSTDRVIVLPEDISTLLAQYINTLNYVDEFGHLFYNQHRHPLTPRNLDAYFEKVLAASGIESKYTIKDFRSRSILDMVNSSIRNKKDLSAVASYTGIKDLRLNTYVAANAIVGECPADLVNFRVIKKEE